MPPAPSLAHRGGERIAAISRQHINAYRRTLAEQHRVTGSLNEGVVSKAFADLLERTGRSRDLIFTPQWEGRGPRGNHIRVDGALIPSILRVPFGYWEAKDEKDDLDREIAAKLARGYPDDNIIYEDTRTAVLRQDGAEVMRVAMRPDDRNGSGGGSDGGGDDRLLALIDTFYAYERPELSEFRAASAKFRENLPQVLDALRLAIAEAEARSADFARARADFLAHARQAINPSVADDDVREMLIQHILTEEIFASVFDNAQYHRENNVARRLGELEAKFFTGALRHATTELLRPYYGAIRHAASGLADRREKQTFLKKLYEDFYKVYNPAAADRLGVVYTPGEIVRFMVRGAEWLTERHFGKTLADQGVEILDPATGTGTFVVELIEHMQGAGRERLRAKYADELHANEVAILPYYVANLNIEATYAAIAGEYAEFPGLVFVDTLDNTAGLGIYKGHQGDMFGGIADENLERVKRQNAAKISVIIGNPPYNAWQSDYNARNANRPYDRVDTRIGQTYRRLSRAQNTNALSDMYVRFWRWASDRLRDDGVIALVTNRNFIEKVAFDGFRLSMAEEFAECWIMDLGGDVRANPKLSGTKHNIFGIQTGVAIAFMVRDARAKGFKLFYARRPEDETGAEKRAFLDGVQDFDRWEVAALKPDAKGNWLSRKDNDFDKLIPVFSEKGSAGVFERFSMATQPKIDGWLYAHDRQHLRKKMTFFVSAYNDAVSRQDEKDTTIKWHRELIYKLKRRVKIVYDENQERLALWRPYSARWSYDEPLVVSMNFQQQQFFSQANTAVVVSGIGATKDFVALATSLMPNHDLLEKAQVGPRYRYLKSGERVDNITDWALARFRAHYADPAITRDDIFAYCYAALHDPVFREVHAANLRREFPRVPLNPDFARWRDWGRALLDLHIGYEAVTPLPLNRTDTPDAKDRAPTPKLRSMPEEGVVMVDSETRLSAIPAHAWTYRLGNRSAIDWVLDQHKEKTPRDPTIAARFNTYRFADHKEAMITLLAKVARVSVDTVAITEAMRDADRATGAA